MTHDLARYVGRHDANLVELVQIKLNSYALPEIEPELLRSELADAISTEEVVTLLDELNSDGILFEETYTYCSSESCSAIVPAQPLGPDAIKAKVCDICDENFVDAGEPTSVRHYLTKSPNSRDIRWMIVVHGFNRKEPWQEKLSWLISNKLAYAAPVLIYKYGFERLGIFFRCRHNILVKRLGKEITAAFEHSKSLGKYDSPDVIIHSFGSLLFSKLLDDDEFQDLKFGRVICVGSIISPLYDWGQLIDGGRIRSVLCHCGSKDKPVQMAQFAIPDSGPSGHIGFADTQTKNILDTSFAHSTALEPNNLSEQLKNGGVWDRFLTDPEGKFEDKAECGHPIWHSWWPIVRWGTRTVILAILAAIVWLVWYLTASAYFMIF